MSEFTVTEPGVYDGLPDEVYHGDPVPGGSLSVSGAKLLLPPSCPAKFRWAADNPQPPKQVFDFGKAAHALALGDGPAIEVIPGDWRTKAAKEAVAEARERAAVPLHEDEYERVIGMAAALKEHPLASVLFTNGKPEQSAFWQDPDTGIWRRARFDWLPGVASASGRLILADYKTAASAEPDKFGRSAADFGYHMQAAWYVDTVIALGINDAPAFVFVAQEKDPPYVVTVAQFAAHDLEVGRALNRKALGIYAECIRTNTWPGYADDVVDLELPGYYLTRIEELIA